MSPAYHTLNTISTPTALSANSPSKPPLDPRDGNAFSAGSRTHLWSQNPALGGTEKNKSIAQRIKEPARGGLQSRAQVGQEEAGLIENSGIHLILLYLCLKVVLPCPELSHFVGLPKISPESDVAINEPSTSVKLPFLCTLLSCLIKFLPNLQTKTKYSFFLS